MISILVNCGELDARTLCLTSECVSSRGFLVRIYKNCINQAVSHAAIARTRIISSLNAMKIWFIITHKNCRIARTTFAPGYVFIREGKIYIQRTVRDCTLCANTLAVRRGKRAISTSLFTATRLFSECRLYEPTLFARELKVVCTKIHLQLKKCNKNSKCAIERERERGGPGRGTRWEGNVRTPVT